MAWRAALILAWVVVLVLLLLVVSDDQAALYVVAGLALTIGVGALIDRPWVFAVPTVVTIVLVGGIFLLIGGCDDECGGDDGFFAIVEWFLLVFTLPATAAMVAGVGLRRMGRR